MSETQVYDELPEGKKRGPKSSIEPLLRRYLGKWVALRGGVQNPSVSSSYARARWVREAREQGMSVEFAVRDGVLYGRMQPIIRDMGDPPPEGLAAPTG